MNDNNDDDDDVDNKQLFPTTIYCACMYQNVVSAAIICR